MTSGHPLTRKTSMATITRTKAPVAAAPVAKVGRAAAAKAGVGIKPKLELALPQEPTEPSQELGDYTWLIYGEQGVGKTSLCARFPDAFFFKFEPGGKALRIKAEPVPTWEHFTGYIDLLYANPDYARTLIVDTVDRAYDRCFEFVAKREGFKHPSERNDFGQSWKAISSEFSKQMDRLLESGRGVVFLSHVDVLELQSRKATSYNKFVPSVSKSTREYLSGPVDMIGYYGYYGADRYLTIRGSDEVDAKCRPELNFLTTTGEQVNSIPMGTSADEAWNNLNSGFQNLFEDPYVPGVAARLSEVRAKKAVKK